MNSWGQLGLLVTLASILPILGVWRGGPEAVLSLPLGLWWLERINTFQAGHLSLSLLPLSVALSPGLS
jgi:hypothetical protein